MALYALGDTHLSFGTRKEMDVFGGAWVGYMDKLKDSLGGLTAEDTLVLCGDLSWAMSLQEGIADFAFLAGLPCRILMLKGNHDYWWTTVSKMNTFFRENGFTNLDILHNNCYFYGDVALCGTRGWFFEEDRGEHSEKIFNRELMRLEQSLKQGGDCEKICFLHYPPVTHSYRCSEIMQLLKKYQVKQCFFGHLHGKSHYTAVQTQVDDVDYRLVSADYLSFQPFKIIE